MSTADPAAHLMNTYGRLPMTVSHGQGVYVWDSNGKQYLEGLAGLWCTSLGYGNEELAQVAHDQMVSLSFQHMFNGKSHEPAMLLAEKL
jgi:adenosylmethionine-8-amino-7-oxononanoate aminotransferase